MNWSSASGRQDIEAELRRIGGRDDDDVKPAEAALLLAALDRPGVSLDRYRHHLSLLERDTADLGAKLGAEGDLKSRVAALNEILLDRYAYQGDQLNYDDLQNANMMRVIDRRKGLPVALGILYIHAARAQGWDIAGLNFPGHFLLRLQLGSQAVILDPFNQGALRTAQELRALIKAVAGEEAELRPEHIQTVSPRDVLIRLQNNIKVRLAQEERAADALEVIENILIFAPGNAGLWQEAGVLHAHLGNLRAAILALEHFLELSGPGPAAQPQRHQAAQLLQQLKGQLN